MDIVNRIEFKLTNGTQWDNEIDYVILKSFPAISDVVINMIIDAPQFTFKANMGLTSDNYYIKAKWVVYYNNRKRYEGSQTSVYFDYPGESIQSVTVPSATFNFSVEDLDVNMIQFGLWYHLDAESMSSSLDYAQIRETSSVIISATYVRA